MKDLNYYALKYDDGKLRFILLERKLDFNDIELLNRNYLLWLICCYPFSSAAGATHRKRCIHPTISFKVRVIQP